MANTRRMTRKLSNDSPKSWANLHHDLLRLIMMHLGLFDFIAFKGVCKSWSSFAVINWNKFMMSKQPMCLSISNRLNKKDCYLEDYTRRKLKSTIPHSNGRICVGITCGYLIFFGKKTCDFWLVNPFTRKELHFPGFPFDVSPNPSYTRGILVFSPSMSGCVFVVSTSALGTPIAFSLAGEEARWHYVKSSHSCQDLHFFMGKIYTLDSVNRLYELKINPEPTLTLLQMKNFPWSPSYAFLRKLEFVSSGENLYVMDALRDAFEVGFGEMNWVSSERTIGKFAVFVSDSKCAAAIKAETWAHPWMRYEDFNYSDGCYHSKKSMWRFTTNMWYFPHECLELKDKDSGMENCALVNTLEE